MTDNIKIVQDHINDSVYPLAELATEVAYLRKLKDIVKQEMGVRPEKDPNLDDVKTFVKRQDTEWLKSFKAGMMSRLNLDPDTTSIDNACNRVEFLTQLEAIVRASLKYSAASVPMELGHVRSKLFYLVELEARNPQQQAELDYLRRLKACVRANLGGSEDPNLEDLQNRIRALQAQAQPSQELQELKIFEAQVQESTRLLPGSSRRSMVDAILFLDSLEQMVRAELRIPQSSPIKIDELRAKIQNRISITAEMERDYRSQENEIRELKASVVDCQCTNRIMRDKIEALEAQLKAANAAQMPPSTDSVDKVHMDALLRSAGFPAGIEGVTDALQALDRALGSQDQVNKKAESQLAEAKSEFDQMARILDSVTVQTGTVRDRVGWLANGYRNLQENIKESRRINQAKTHLIEDLQLRLNVLNKKLENVKLIIEEQEKT